MSNIYTLTLRKAAERACADNHTQDEWFHYLRCSTPETVLALLDELEAKDSTIATQQQEIRALLNALGQASEKRNAEQADIIAKQEKWIKDVEATMIAATDRAEAAEKRIAELEAREVKLPELKMLRDYLAEVTHREREDILVGVRLEFFRALEEVGVKVAAAAGKGEAS